MSYTPQSMPIHRLMLDLHDYYLPAIQREFVWPSDKIEALFESLLRGYPIGTLLLWDVRAPAVHDFQFYELIRDFDVRARHNVQANLSIRQQCVGILDGQQRITALRIGLQGSYTERLPRRWWNKPESFPKKRLHLNLLYVPKGDDHEQEFEVRFLSEAELADTGNAYWYPVGDILKLVTRDALREFRRSTPHRDSDAFEKNLDALWTAVFDRHSISYFLETRQDLDDVLRIFVRLNTGGTPLSHSDLLLSLATAAWKTHDAREQVYALVDYLNKECGATFWFSKDFVLKALLMCSDRDIRFRAENVRRKHELEDIWDRVEAALKATVKLASACGFTGYTLSAPNALIPVAYYLFSRGLDDTVLTGNAHAEDRERIRVWLLKILLGKVFRGQTDQTLSNIRTAIREALQGGPGAAAMTFPAAAVDDTLRRTRAFRFSYEDVEAIVSETRYGEPDAFATLALLYPHYHFDHVQFHIDHIHPRAGFTTKALSAAGMATDAIRTAVDRRDLLPNLQLLTGPMNEHKTAKPFAKWLDEQDSPPAVRALNFIPDVDLALGNFHQFYEERHKKLTRELAIKLGFDRGPLADAEAEAEPSSASR